MGSKSERTPVKKAAHAKKSHLGIFLGIGVLIVLTACFFLIKEISGADRVQQDGKITIKKSEITSTAKFIPYNANGIYMEIVAVKAPDGTIRTALNTCQVCYNSGRGYYKQEGNVLVCQNCFNRFQINQVEKQKNGCNPVPILEENKTDNGDTITISQEFLQQNKDLFSRWKKS